MAERKDDKRAKAPELISDDERDIFAEEQIVEFPADRMINTTGTNEYATDMRDETLWDKDLIDTDVAVADEIPDMVNEHGLEERPIYDENGFRHERE